MASQQTTKRTFAESSCASSSAASSPAKCRKTRQASRQVIPDIPEELWSKHATLHDTLEISRVPPQTVGLGTKSDPCCPICLEGLHLPPGLDAPKDLDGGLVRHLGHDAKCKRTFHRPCMEGWVAAARPSDDVTCPICRGVIVKRPLPDDNAVSGSNTTRPRLDRGSLRVLWDYWEVLTCSNLQASPIRTGRVRGCHQMGKKEV